MKTTLLTLLLILSIAVSLSQTQGDGRMMAEKSDKRLNDAYQMLLAAKRSDTLFIKNLRVSQRIWIQFREADLTLIYPHQLSIEKSDSLTIGRANYFAQLTEDRTKTLL